MSRKGQRVSRGFAVFAIGLVGLLVLGLLAASTGELFGTSDDADPTPDADAEVQRLQTAVAANPADLASTSVLATILSNQGRASEAIPLFERLIEADPDNGRTRLAFGIALFRSGNPFDAEIQLLKAHELTPDRPDAAYYLGQLYEGRDNPDLAAAREWYQRAIDIAPDSLTADQAAQRLAELDGSATPSATP
jgi:tetratricopeptide (TPR) repeat protein